MNRTDDRPSGVSAAHLLVGPTASGKSAVAQVIAERRRAIILSADSMQVYRGMDIGTAKSDAASRARVPQAGLDLVTPHQTCDVATWLDAARRAARGEQPLIVVGGTGLYVKALIHGLSRLPPQNPELRAELRSLVEREGVGALQQRLKEDAPSLYQGLKDPANPRRLVRALELAAAGITEPPGDWRADGPKPRVAGLRWTPGALNSRIEARVRDMYDNGLADEVSALIAGSDELSETAMKAIGYAEALALLRGECTREAAMALTARRTRQYAKRQRTWFAHQLDVRWIDCDEGKTLEQTAADVEAAWHELGPTPLEGLIDGGQHEQQV